MTIEAKIGLLKKATSRLRESYDVIRAQESAAKFEQKLSNCEDVTRYEFRLYSIGQSQINEYQGLVGKVQRTLGYATQVKELDDSEFLSDAEGDIDVVVDDIRQFVLGQKMSRYEDNSADCVVSFAPGEGKYSPDIIRDFTGAYSKFARRMGFEVDEVSFDDDLSPGFLVRASMNAQLPYGTLRGEDGVHKFIYSDGTRARTFYVGVQVEKQEPTEELTMDKKNLKYEFLASTGPGGQNVNKNATSVRLTHDPTGIQVTVRGRHRARNIEAANWKIRQKVAALQDERAPRNERQVIEAGRSFRMYDLRKGIINDRNSGLKLSNLGNFFKGDIEPFVKGFYGVDF